MTLDEAINHAEEVAKEQDKLCKRYDDASGYTRSHNKDIRTTDAKRCEECAEEHRQLAEWLKDYKRLLEQEPCEDCINTEPKKIDEWDICGKPAELWIVNCKIQIRHRGTIHNVSLPSIQPTAKENLVVGDCISRQAVIEHYNSGEILQCNHVSRNGLLNYIEALPPVTPNPKIGHWIIVETLHGEWEGTKKYACDNCGKRVGVFKSNYCPNCGAKMSEFPTDSEKE